MATPPWQRRVGILGLGLMGESLARELAACRVAVSGYDAREDTVREAQEAGVLAHALPASLEGLEQVDLLVLAVPVDRAGDVLARALPRLAPGCVITDLGSTKRSIEAAVTALGIADRFVGSHPLTGSHRSGWSASHRDLYAWSRVFLCPTPHTTPDAVQQVREMWELVGALPEIVDAAEHDLRVAWVSHLPQVTSTCLALALAEKGMPRRELGPGGQDATRLAASSPEMWSAICLDNADLIEDALAALDEALHRLRAAVGSRDGQQLARLFSSARTWAEEERPG